MRVVIKYILWVLAKLVLLRHRPLVVAVTGSVGKSTTKEAIFSVLSHKFPREVRKNQENLNTEIGVPLTIIGGQDAKRNLFLWFGNFIRGVGVIFSSRFPKILILEMAADKPGDIDYLTKLARPDIGVITAIGEIPVHLEFYPNRQALVREKSLVVRRLKSGGIAVLNFDDDTVRSLAAEQAVTYGLKKGADIRGTGHKYDLPKTPDEIGQESINFTLEYKEDKKKIQMFGALGKGVLYAALAAAAVGVARDMSLQEVARALDGFKPLKNRTTLRAGIKNSIIIDDTYNASPLSMEVALELLSQFKDRRKIAVLGDMRELGENNKRAHFKVVAQARRAADKVILVGENMKMVEKRNTFWFTNIESAGQFVLKNIQKGDVVLIKGSRAVGLEKVIKIIT